MSPDVFSSDLGNLAPEVCDACISYRDVNVVDAVRCELRNHGRCTRGDGRIILYDDEGRLLGHWKIRQVFGGWMVRVTDRGNSQMVWPSDIDIEETLANSSIAASDEITPQ